MDVVTYTDARASLKDVMDQVINDRVEVVVTRKKREAVVVMSLEKYNAIQETLHLQKTLQMSTDYRRALPNWTRAKSLNVTFWREACLLGLRLEEGLERVNDLIKASCRQPFTGVGKPEPLKGDLAGWWSGRITKERRLVCRVSGKAETQALEITQLRYHY